MAEGLEDPLQLRLTGNACKDLAGTLLTLENKGEVVPLPATHKPFVQQVGHIGDLKA